MKSSQILDIVNGQGKGFYIGSRLILPFKCQFIKLIADSHVYTEFVGNKDIKVSQDPLNTSIYFRETGRLSKFEDSYKSIKFIVAGTDEDLTNRDSHLKVVCHIQENHDVEIEIPSDDILFID